MTLSNSMSITPSSPGQAKGERFEHGSVLGGKTRSARVSSQWKSTSSSRAAARSPSLGAGRPVHYGPVPDHAVLFPTAHQPWRPGRHRRHDQGRGQSNRGADRHPVIARDRLRRCAVAQRQGRFRHRFQLRPLNSHKVGFQM